MKGVNVSKEVKVVTCVATSVMEFGSITTGEPDYDCPRIVEQEDDRYRGQAGVGGRKSRHEEVGWR